MRRLSKIAGYIIGAAVTAAALAGLVVPGCTGQNQNNSPITVNNSQGRFVLSVACSTDGSVAYVTDGRNVYRYDRNVLGDAESWECILSQGQRVEMAGKHDPREQPPSEGGSGKAGPKGGKET